MAPNTSTENNSPPPEGCPPQADGVVHAPPEIQSINKVVHAPPEIQSINKVVHAPPEMQAINGVATPIPILCSIHNIPIRRNFVENLPCNHTLSQRARLKRKAGILPEVLFWQQVHKGAFHKIDFDRQRIIGNYIVDFYVKALGLVIEIDGSSHDNKVEYDRKRQHYLEDCGLRVYRITNGDIKMNPDVVMAELESYIVKEYGIITPSAKVDNHPI